MRKISLAIIVGLVSLVSIAQETASILFIGNSYTYVNDLPVLLESIASSMGDQVIHDSQTPGGATFQQHANTALTYSKINSNAWDYVVLQAQSQEPSFPETQVNTNTLPYAQQIADSVYANNFCSEVIMFMTWGRENGDPQWAPISTFEGMNTRLRDAYLRMSDSVQGSVSPVGSAWRYARENFPSINLYSGDGSHPSYAGSYLAACTFYSSIFRKPATGVPFIGSLSQATADNLQLAATLSVMDSLDTWNLRPISEHTNAEFQMVFNDPTIDFINQSTKATNYYWDFGDGELSTIENPSHLFLSNGQYDVRLVAESPCDTDTTVYEVTINGYLGFTDLDKGIIRIKNLGNGIFDVQSDNTIIEMKVYNMEGREVSCPINETTIYLSKYKQGIYILKIETEKEVVSIRLVNI